MDDLASIVLDQLKLRDGPAPVALVHRRFGTHENNFRWLVINVERVNGNAVYKVNVAAGSWHAHRDANGAPTWTVLTFANEKEAAAFATAHLRGEKEADLSLYELDAKKWRASRSTASFCDCLAREFGSYNVTTETDVLFALRALMPLSMVVGGKRVF
jgi:hypothetical protein